MSTDREHGTMKRYNFFMHTDIYEALTKAAERRRVSRSQLLRDILVKVLRLDAPPSDERLVTSASPRPTETRERVAERIS